MIKFDDVFGDSEWTDRKPREPGKMTRKHENSKAVNDINGVEKNSRSILPVIQLILTMLLGLLAIGSISYLFYWAFMMAFR